MGLWLLNRRHNFPNNRVIGPHSRTRLMHNCDGLFEMKSPRTQCLKEVLILQWKIGLNNFLKTGSAYQVKNNNGRAITYLPLEKITKARKKILRRNESEVINSSLRSN